MKRLLAGILLLASMSSFANEYLYDISIFPKQAKLKRKYRNDIKRLRLTLFASEATFNKKRVQDELNELNSIYATCGIQTETEVEVKIYNFSRYPSWEGSVFGGANKNDSYWGDMALAEYSEEIPVMLLEYNVYGGGWGVNYLNIGAVTKTVDTPNKSFNYPSEELRAFVKNHFPKYMIFLANYMNPQISERLTYEDAIVTLAHEVGHIIFDEGHNSGFKYRKNLMKDFAEEGKPLRSTAKKINKDQCKKARAFISNNNTH